MRAHGGGGTLSPIIWDDFFKNRKVDLVISRTAPGFTFSDEQTAAAPQCLRSVVVYKSTPIFKGVNIFL